MNEQMLKHMYQAWLQGNNNYVSDWLHFVDFVSKINGTANDILIKELMNYSWCKTTK